MSPELVVDVVVIHLDDLVGHGVGHVLHLVVEVLLGGAVGVVLLGVHPQLRVLAMLTAGGPRCGN